MVQWKKRILSLVMALALVATSLAGSYAATNQLPSGTASGGGDGGGGGSSAPFDFRPGYSTIRDGETNVPLDSILMFYFDKAVSQPETLASNGALISVYDENRAKVPATVTVVPIGIAMPSEYATQSDFESAYRRYLTVNITGGLQAGRTYEIVLRSGITARNGNDKTTEEYTVTFATIPAPKPEPEPKPIKAQSVSLNRSAMDMEQGDSYQLAATVYPSDSEEKSIVWSSSDHSVASVNGSGLVEAKGVGTATITARVRNSDVQTTAFFRITAPQDTTPIQPGTQEVDATSLRLDASKINLFVGDKERITATVNPTNSKQKTVDWTSSDPNVVTVDADGTIEAKGVGTASIAAKVRGTSLTKQVEVVVAQRPTTDPNPKPVDIDPNPNPAARYTDIAQHWANAHIVRTTERGLFSGTSETTFAPELNMTRGMFVTVLGKLSGERSSYFAKFSDVPEAAYYANHVTWAEKNDIVAGYPDGRFQPDNNISREEMAVMIYKYLDYKKIPIRDTPMVAFGDIALVNDWAKVPVERLQRAGIFTGKGANQFNPKDDTTRAEVATVLDLLLRTYIE